MKNKRLMLLIFLLSCLIDNNQVIDAQNKAIPIIKYTPDDFVKSVRLSFLKVNKGNYIEIDKDSLEKTFLLNINGKEDIIINNPDNYAIWQKKRILKSDSIFILYFRHKPDIRFYGKLPIKYFGKLESSKVLFFLNEPNDDRLYSLYELIIKEFGDIDSFRSEIIKDVEENLDRNIMNGLYPTDRESARAFLHNDFEFYERCFPESKQKISSLLMDFIDSSILCSQCQKNNIREMLKDISNNSSVPSILKSKDYSLRYMGVDLFEKLSLILDRFQLTALKRKDGIRKYLMDYYISILSKKLVWISKENDEFLILTEDEKSKQLKEDVYGFADANN
jgi:hypothetical protein